MRKLPCRKGHKITAGRRTHKTLFHHVFHRRAAPAASNAAWWGVCEAGASCCCTAQCPRLTTSRALDRISSSSQSLPPAGWLGRLDIGQHLIRVVWMRVSMAPLKQLAHLTFMPCSISPCLVGTATDLLASLWSDICLYVSTDRLAAHSRRTAMLLVLCCH